MKTCLAISGIAAALAVVSCVAPMRAAAQGRSNSAVTENAIKTAAAKPTPRTADGHPDLNGSWRAPEFDVDAHVGNDGTIFIDVPPDKGGTTPQLERSLDDQLKPPVDRNPPPYKPELLEKVHAMALDEVHNDPAFRCMPLGVPRIGAPRQIIQTPKLMLFLYQVDGGIGDQPGSFRLVPIDGRPHNPEADPSFFGDSVGRWDGDTLVVDVNHLNDQTWLAGGDGGSGYFHSDALHVIERITRRGDTLRWEASAEDPNVLTKPWQMNPQTEVLIHTMVYEQPICEERETPHFTNKY